MEDESHMYGSIPIAASNRMPVGDLSHCRKMVVVEANKGGTFINCAMEMIGIEPMT